MGSFSLRRANKGEVPCGSRLGSLDREFWGNWISGDKLMVQGFQLCEIGWGRNLMWIVEQGSRRLSPGQE